MPSRSALGLVALFCLSASPLARAAAPGEQPLFKFEGKTYAPQDLPTADQQQLFETRNECYMRLEAITDQVALNLYFDELSKKEGKPRADVEQKALAVGEPTEQQTKDWYEQNKARIPPGYTYEKIAPEIKNGLKEQNKKDKREQLVAQLKKDGKLTFLVPEPVTPVIAVDTAGYPSKGPASAPVTLIEFADYQCPHCKAAAPQMDAVVKKFDGKVRFVFIDYPIKGEFSDLAAQGAYCAGQQGKYWDMHDKLYAKQDQLHDKDAAAKLAKEVSGLDEKTFAGCMSSAASKEQVKKGRKEGDRIGLTGTPTVYVNGKRVKGYESADLEKAVEAALKGGKG